MIFFRVIPNANLQEAFKKHKKHFIERSEARVQTIKDGVLKEKHGGDVMESKSQHGNVGIEKRRTSPGKFLFYDFYLMETNYRGFHGIYQTLLTLKVKVTKCLRKILNIFAIF